MSNKKQPVYLLCKENKKIVVKEASGYVIDLTNKCGYTTKIALIFDSGWTATHYESGLSCTPYTKASGERVLKWKKEELIERLKDIDFESTAKRNKGFEEYISLINEYKGANQK
jgi:hypothetical protein